MIIIIEISSNPNVHWWKYCRTVQRCDHVVFVFQPHLDRTPTKSMPTAGSSGGMVSNCHHQSNIIATSHYTMMIDVVSIKYYYMLTLHNVRGSIIFILLYQYQCWQFGLFIFINGLSVNYNITIATNEFFHLMQHLCLFY